MVQPLSSTSEELLAHLPENEGDEFMSNELQTCGIYFK